VFAISSIGKKLLEKLQRKAYRHAYLAQHVRRGIAYQIRAMRDQRKWKQGTFAQSLGKPQSVVSRLEDPDYGKVTLQTLLEVANVFDVALEVRFVSYSTFICNTRDVSIPSMRVPEFKSDLGLMGLSPILVRGGQQLIVAGAGTTNEINASAGLLTFDSAQQVGSLTLH
jgi:transcriptional regulator with XRE-family HTH domain